MTIALDGTTLTSQSLLLIALVTILSLAPGLAIMVTCFPFLVTVLSILRQAIGLQQSPPNMLIVSLALFLTWFIMEPTFTEAWTEATGGHSDDSSLLTLFVCIAAQAPPRTLLTEKAATTLVRKIRKSGFAPELASQFIAQHAPVQHQEDCVRMWADFLHEAQSTLQSSFDYELKDALALLDAHCNLS